MATYRVGQRVRIVQLGFAVHSPRHLIGMEGRIVGVFLDDEWEYAVLIPGSRPYQMDECGPDEWFFDAEELAPLTDPRAEEFIADMERYAHIAKEKNVKEPA